MNMTGRTLSMIRSLTIYIYLHPQLLGLYSDYLHLKELEFSMLEVISMIVSTFAR